MSESVLQKSREEFEKWARSSKFKDTNFAHSMCRGADTGNFAAGAAQFAWEAWQASRERKSGKGAKWDRVTAVMSELRKMRGDENR